MQKEDKPSDYEYYVKNSKGDGFVFPICDKWIDKTELVSFGGIIGNGTSALVVLTSFVLRKFFISLV